MKGLDSSKQNICGIIGTRDEVTVMLCIGSPENNDMVEVIIPLELTDIQSYKI